MKKKLLLLATVLTTFCVSGAFAAVSPQQAAQLGTTLTPWGAIKAGSADGMVPAYTGGILAVSNLPTDQTGWGPTDPFAAEKPLFTVTSANMAQYDALLTPGEKALLQRYPSYFLKVYPSHRTMSYPDWVNQNSLKDATSASEVGVGGGISGAYGGVPFPIPSDGTQVMWNATLSYHPAYCHEAFQNWLVDTAGNVTDLGNTEGWWVMPYYNPQATSMPTNFFQYFKVLFHSPPPVNGTVFLFQYPYDFTKSDDLTWFYDPGTRRVRVAPEFKYDTPIASYGGAIDFDETDLFYGAMDKFDFKLVGEQEKIVPYNDFAMFNTSKSQLILPQTLNPAVIRYEVHRVWVINATLKPGERHAYSQWNFYVDEDSWAILASESYDHAGAIYRVGAVYPYSVYYDGAAAVNFSRTFNFYDLSKGNYEITRAANEPGELMHCSTALPNMSNYTPQAVAAQGVQ